MRPFLSVNAARVAEEGDRQDRRSPFFFCASPNDGCPFGDSISGWLIILLSVARVPPCATTSASSCSFFPFSRGSRAEMKPVTILLEGVPLILHGLPPGCTLLERYDCHSLIL